jgi:hypothetical protein
MITIIYICIVLIPTLTYAMTLEASSRGGERGSSCSDPAPAACYDADGGAVVSPIRCREPHPSRAMAPCSASAASSSRPLPCRPQPPRSAPTRPPSCTARLSLAMWVRVVVTGAQPAAAELARAAVALGLGSADSMGSLAGDLHAAWVPRQRPRCSTGEQHRAPRR